MKIAYLTNTRFPSERAYAVQIVHMCNAFSEVGNEVTLFVTDRPTKITQSAEVFYGTPFKFSYVRITVPDIAGFVSRLPRWMQPAVYSLQRIFFVLRVVLHLRSENYDCVYGRDEWVLAPLTFLIKNKIIWESHEAKFSWAVRRLLRCSGKLIAISEGIKGFYIDKGVSPNSIHVAHDAVDESFFRPTRSRNTAREELGINLSEKVVMYIGGLDTWKGVSTLFETAKLYSDDFGVYVIGGRDSELESYRTLYPQIHFLGSRPYKELLDHQQAADILVIPNTAKNKLSAVYTSPLKLFAYMTSKVPIVASRIPSLTNVISEKEAFFFTADDHIDLGKILCEVLSGHQLATSKANAAFELSKKYTWSNRAAGIITFLGK